jgi:queuosine precursor transporter
MKNQISTIAMLSIVSYIAAQILSDVSSLKIASFMGLSIDAGTFIYPFTFTIRDLIHKIWGKAMARKIIITAAVINLFMALFFQFVIWLPSDPSWGLQDQFATILGPVWRIVIASILAEVISELVDTEAYQYFIDKISKKFQWARVLFSNFIAIPLDSLIFSFVAFYGQLPIEVVWSIVLANILVKGAFTLLSLPLIYLTKDESKAY